MKRFVRSCSVLVVCALTTPHFSEIATAEMEPSLPEAPNQSYLDPCANYDIDDVISSTQEHDGVRFQFVGANSTYSALFDLYYLDHRGSTYTCQRNSNLDQSVTNPSVLFDFGYSRTSADRRDMWGRITDIQSILDSFGSNQQNSCYICGLARNRNGCFPPGVEVALDDQGVTKLVEDVVVGDRLWNPLLRKHATVLKVIEGPEAEPLLEFGYGAVVLKASQQHPVLTATGLKMASELSLEDVVYASDGSPRQLEFVRALPIAVGQFVLNFILDADTNSEFERMIVADGIVTGEMTLQRELASARSR